MTKDTTTKHKNLSINDAITQFIFHCRYEKKLDIKTIKSYETDLKQFTTLIEKKFKRTNVYDITKEILKSYVQSISCFKPKTTKRKLASVKAMFNFLTFENDDFENPFHKIKIRIKEPTILPTVMNINEVSKILELLYKEYHHNNNKSMYQQKMIIRNITIVELLFATGVRVSELCNIKCTDIDFLNGNIKIFGKGGKERIIHICQQSVWGHYPTNCVSSKNRVQGYP
ncbi:MULTISPECIES: tyrosine-type recombinase/integrase [Pasteurellaceae]|uniref:Tyrosine-type recombinase/integrase n=1 Tax=Pasteurella atlantica TaxID=2827233 RepID=A0AAW8CQV4_9PAST|nr:tyrosine-type recombinase/integrase [Pasteurella atlantica]MBR0573828.1 tyrosine-type recombinase/integrase [Pasteurella atlantica]MDP8039763.1 tyrosine-type recombinase/integrase [Pasteurella atlantica]MDP8041948.1 tyrosine-type recombinase/integrase [Pasteurella atlantica]MDP8044027.1 tyrosine-type recombinase/integrase [Pasteurella atlantica]MDP8046005.1 tyrosine-type recombinase/integrase [Pasteurella atlantica]